MESGSYMDRAFRAYFRSGATDQPSSDGSTLEEYKGLRYIVLRNSVGTLAVYRILNSKKLKRLKRYPVQIEISRPEEEEQGFRFGFSKRDYEIMRLADERRAKMQKVRNANRGTNGGGSIDEAG